METKRISIIGLGLIGGSLAKAIREKLGKDRAEIAAVSRSKAPLDKALSEGVIDYASTELNDIVYSSDIIFLCTPVNDFKHYIDSLKGKIKAGCIITDVGSTKGEVVDYINSLPDAPCFVGGHPMAGTEKTGYKAGYAHLFENAYFILTPCKSTTQAAMDALLTVIEAIGAIPVIMEAAEHDRVTGCVSHIPHIIASALVNLVKISDTADGKMKMLAAGGFKDITRIASSSPELWQNIISSNKDTLLALLDSFNRIIKDISECIHNDARDEIIAFFENARSFRDSVSDSRRGLLGSLCEITVDVVDKPGIIGKIATLLGDKGINIKNINVSNSREFEQGCLKITLPDRSSASAAFDLLSSFGYRVFKND